MKYSFQVPIPHMDDFIGDADFFYCLAHLAMTKSEYCDWFIGRPTILDNGVHELGTPMYIDDLFQVADMVQPLAIIPPDYLFDTQATLAAMDRALQRWPVERLWPAVQGRTFEELQESMQVYHSMRVPRVCIPYRLGAQVRIWLARVADLIGIKVHFLGVSSLDELKGIRFHPDASIDTGKPFRWAQHNQVWPQGECERKINMNQSLNINLARRGINAMKRVTEFETT